ncbi:hypothetical protein Fmac_014824 [Flemingia macrophylla]|uniref:RRM domain-containing protein n=1 Tax=Flemingia macrophylla TaxID=520843 RepID=A0ABD1MCT0_9FABA
MEETAQLVAFPMKSPFGVPEKPEFSVGLDVPLSKLKMELLKEGVSIIVLTGLGGSGKTTLATKLCWDEHVKDDVWPGSEALVEKVKFHLSDCKILVTSRFACPTFGTSSCVLKPLLHEDAMTLFRHYAFSDGNSLNTPHDDLVQKVVKNCKGLPLAIKVIGRSLRHQPYELWQKMVEELSQGHSILDSNSELLTYLQKILDVLEDNTLIKECFMDLGLFPEDQRIPVTALIDMWAELYGLDNDGIEAMTIINKLDSMNLVNVIIARTYVEIYDTHNSYWSHMQPAQAKVLIVNLRTKQYSFPESMINMSKLKVLIVTNYSFHPSELTNFELLGSLSKLKRIRLERICVHSFVKLKNLTKLSLYMCSMSHAFQNDNILISEAFPHLVDLSIDYCKDMEVLPNGVCDITPLKKLSVTNCHKLLKLPQEIGNLVNLELLRLNSCTDLEGIPDSIGGLSNLRHLDISNCISLFNLPEDFGKLFNLRNLNMTSCARCELPSSVVNLVNLKIVICDEETASSWEGFEAMLPNLLIEVPQVDVNLNWLHSVSSQIWKYDEEVSGVCCYNHFNKVPPHSSSNSIPLPLFSTLSSFLQQALCGRSLSRTSILLLFLIPNSYLFNVHSDTVSGLSWSVDEKSLKDAFSSFGDVTQGPFLVVRVVYDKDSGRSRGFGFVIFTNEDDAKCAKHAMDGKALLGRPLRINFALEKARGVPVVVPRLLDTVHPNRR